ncbi:hypothetical protein [Pedobacter polysacchareus]|uniref:hypothetical protein n=1 Tax=Pedobacter polysacchareus TaxID=2861973 RepID=UPI001C99FF66|nr:hypothetical protein [Pedobacter polysacchareus]
MIIKLQKLTTGISIIHEIPVMFFKEIENSATFGHHLFPAWVNGVFGATSLFNKFEAVYNKYKRIKKKSKRDQIIEAFKHSNQIENLCKNLAGSLIIELNDLPSSVKLELDELFLYLYNSAINYHQFESHVNDNLKESINRFIINNNLEVCPFCGLEGFLNIEGQSRIALDHWLCKDLFPMAAVNFDNLFPIGSKCNERPAKGSKNILIDNPVTKNRVHAFYPYLTHEGVVTKFNYINEPSISGILDSDWNFTIYPTNPIDKDIFDSWNNTLNISIRYIDYFRKNILPMWEADYKRFIEEDHGVDHGQNIDELKENLKLWKASFPIKGRPGSILYRCFIDYLIKHASDAYLYGLCENFKHSQRNALRN